MAREKKGEVEERETFAREAMAYLDHLYRIALHLAKEQEGAQDLVQETFARALNSHRQFAPGTNLKAWLTKILYNFFFDRYQESKRWVSLDATNYGPEGEANYWEHMASSEPGPEAFSLQQEMGKKISEALRGIPEEYRMPILLVDIGDFSYAEAAEVLSCPIGTVRSRLSRGRRLMCQRLRVYVEARGKD